jgi:hypothetical protein
MHDVTCARSSFPPNPRQKDQMSWYQTSRAVLLLGVKGPGDLELINLGL